MKKLINYKVLLLTTLLFSCQSELEEEFINPESTNPPKEDLFGGMFTSMMYEWKIYVQDYGEWWWQMSGNGIPSYTQVAIRYVTPRYGWYTDYDDLVNGLGFDDSAIRDFFDDYYKRMKNYGLMRDELASMSEEEKAEVETFYQLSTVVKNYGALKLVDLYNSIPYSEALRGTEAVFFPKFDDPEEIYKSILDELKMVGETLPASYNKMSEDAKSKLQVQDFAFHGDMDKWQLYINSLRIKFALRMSAADEAFAKAHIQDAFDKGVPEEDLTWPLPFDNNVLSGGTWTRGLYERAFVTFIPNIIMMRMNHNELTYEEGVDDPRLPVIAMPTKHGDYRGASMNADAQDAPYKAGETYYPYADDITASLEQNALSMYNHATYTHNEFPVYMMSRAELDLCLAEAVLKGLLNTGKTAGDHIHDAVVNSTDFWYNIGSLSSYETDVAVLHPQRPSDAVIATYADAVKTEFDSQSGLENQMEVLMQQKFIHLNLMQPYELFAELRRTRHPKLEPMTFQGEVMTPTPERIRYPASSLATNAENYAAVQDQDNFDTPIFWVPESKRNESYYRDGYEY